jgi:hypothetical protein
MTAVPPRAALNLQRRLYDLWTNKLMDAVTLSEEAGPSDRLDEVLQLIQEAEAGVRAAIAAQAPERPIVIPDA